MSLLTVSGCLGHGYYSVEHNLRPFTAEFTAQREMSVWGKRLLAAAHLS